MKLIKRNRYVADFETTNHKTYLETGCTRVWLYAISNSEGVIVNYGGSIEEFMNWCYTHPDSLIYFHNLKFDGSFILNYLLSNDFKYKEKLIKKDSKGFSTLVSGDGAWYGITINFSKNHQVVINDSLKIIPLKVKDIAKAFKLPIEKEVIDYGKYEINEQTLSYVYKDVQIVAMALKFFKDNGFDKMTIGSIAYNDYKNTFKHFEDVYPDLDREWLKKYRGAYRGGRCQVNPKYAGKIMHNVKRYDINSMYPATMVKFPLPYGQPIRCTKPDTYKFELYDLNISFKLKKGHLPTLLKSGSMFAGEDSYYNDSDGIINIQISNIDLLLLKRHYDIEYIEYLEIWGFLTSRNLFKDWVMNYYELKASSTGGMRLIYKLLLNNLYGKFGSKCEGQKKIPNLEGDYLSFSLGEVEEMKVYDLEVAIGITSYAHLMIDDAIMEVGYDNFIYCDTDSVHTIGELSSDKVHPTEIGKFKLEGIEDKSKYIRQKCYMYIENGVYNITCSGMPKQVKDYLIREYKDETFDIFKVGLIVDSDSRNITVDDMKLRPMQVKGGCILTPTPFTIRG